MRLAGASALFVIVGYLLAGRYLIYAWDLPIRLIAESRLHEI